MDHFHFTKILYIFSYFKESFHQFFSSESFHFVTKAFTEGNLFYFRLFILEFKFEDNIWFKAILMKINV